MHLGFEGFHLLGTTLYQIMYTLSRDTFILSNLHQGKIFLIEPETELDIGKLERDKAKLRAGYNQGLRDGEKYWEQVKEYLQGGNGS